MSSYQNACPWYVLVSHALFYFLWLTQMLRSGKQGDAVWASANACWEYDLCICVTSWGSQCSQFLNLPTVVTSSVFHNHYEGGVICEPSVCHTEAPNKNLALFFFLSYSSYRSPMCPWLGFRISKRVPGIMWKISYVQIIFFFRE